MPGSHSHNGHALEKAADMRTRPLFIAGLVFTCLAAYYICFEVHPRPEGLQEKSHEQKIFTLDRKDITGITIQGNSSIVLEKQGSIWQIREPVRSPADQAAVNNLINEVSGLTAQRTLEGERGIAQFGLDHPSFSITLRTAGREYILSIGDKAPASDMCYAKASGRAEIFLLPAQQKQYLGKDLFTLRDKHLLPESYTNADRMRIVRHGMIAEFERDQHGIWRLLGDRTKRLSAHKIDEFIKEMCMIEALSYHEGQGMPRDPDVSMELSSEGIPQRIKIWKQGDKVYAVSDTQKGLVKINSSHIRNIPEDPMEMLDRTIVPLENEKVARIAFSGQGMKVFMKNGDGWYAGGAKIKDSSTVIAFLHSLSTLEYEDEYLMLPKGAGREQGIRITCTGTSAPFDIAVYSKYYVTVGKKVFRVNEGDMKRLVEPMQILLREET